MKETVIDRATSIANYIVKSNATVRKAAQKFSVSKSTVHKDVSERLKKLNPTLYENVQSVLNLNKSQRHIRGGIATKKKFKQIKYSLPEEKNKRKLVKKVSRKST